MLRPLQTKAIAALNLPPIAPVIQSIRIKEGQFIAVKLPTFTDPEGDPIRYYVHEPMLPPGMMYNVLTGSLAGTPTNAGIYPVDYMGKTENENEYTETEFSVIVEPSLPPVVPVLPNRIVKEDQIFSFKLPAFTSPEGSALSYNLSCDCYSESGSHSALPNWIQFDANTRTLSGKAPNKIVQIKVLYSAYDQARKTGSWGEFAVTVSGKSTNSVLNQPAVAPVIQPIKIQQGKHISVQLPVFTDQEGDAILYDANGYSIPPGMMFNALTRSLAGTPTKPGRYLIRYTGRNESRSQFTSTDFSIVVEPNLPPVAPLLPSIVIKENTPFSIQLSPTRMATRFPTSWSATVSANPVPIPIFLPGCSIMPTPAPLAEKRLTTQRISSYYIRPGI
ncbi:hypothetical protein GCM10027299_05810 [Larkinella ripae]